MENERDLIYLAALLHDIGKFYQRADLPFANKQNELSEISKKICDYICPINDNGSFGYQHAIWTCEFFEHEKIKKVLDKLPFPNKNDYDNEENSIFSLASYHHKPSTKLQALISLADWWSAGIDRRNVLEIENDTEKKDNPITIKESLVWGKNRYKKIPLYSIFNEINSGNYKNAYSMQPLSIDDESCLVKKVNTNEDGYSQEQYNKLWNKFVAEFELLPTDSFDGFIESLLFLLKKYTWCIPSNTMDMANVSLYDHLKTTATFADCLYLYHESNPDAFNWDITKKKLSINENGFPVLLLACDISGIQKFIYNIASRKAATSIKGRSFYLQLLIDSIIQRFIMHKDIKATIGHVIYSSGGNFYMLLPNTKKVVDAVNYIVFEIEKEIWDEHKGKLFVNIDFIPFAYRNFRNEIDFVGANTKDLGALWKALADKLIQKKNQKFKNVILNDFKGFFEPKEKGGNIEVCAVTGEELQKDEIYKIKRSDTSDTIVSKKVENQINLGNTLKDVDFLITFKDYQAISTYMSNRLKYKSTILGVENYLLDQLELSKDDTDLSKITSADIGRVKRINNTDFLTTSLKGQKVSYGFQFYGGNKQAAYNNERNKTFEELTRKTHNDSNTETYLGVLRMDVDGLGAIFINGLPDQDKTFSAYATLSSSFDLFFSGYLNTIREKYKDNVNILYSGGDDVFAVGRWDMLISFAEDIREEFRRYVGREDISISAGITIVGNKYPIAKAAQLAGIAEHEAKQYENANLGKKNAINFLGQTVSWKEEFSWVKAKKNQFVSLINNNDMSKAILHKMMLFAEIQENNKRNKNKEGFNPDLSYYWNSAYYLKRFMEKKDENVVAFCKLLQTEVVNSRKLELIALAARWAELEIKEII